MRRACSNRPPQRCKPPSRNRRAKALTAASADSPNGSQTKSSCAAKSKDIAKEESPKRTSTDTKFSHVISRWSRARDTKRALLGSHHTRIDVGWRWGVISWDPSPNEYAMCEPPKRFQEVRVHCWSSLTNMLFRESERSGKVHLHAYWGLPSIAVARQVIGFFFLSTVANFPLPLFLLHLDFRLNLITSNITLARP